eukprot:CAMPEP_0114671162 /NCGR_PEP_ID=MMETSP0191-20121206/40693_1 /TAXON_ID=126664 /ORGANISM="Sorites sp." /LENGTH=353 /DNA_ID=CAMNT_0001930351 /DNA_START=289 /DNA_END=1350 /DNA_ORIENTATION=+
MTNGECVEQLNLTEKSYPAAAVQISYTEGRCFWLASELPSSHSMPDFYVKAYDNNDAGKGITFELNNGQYFNAYDGSKGNRHLVINMVCPDTNRYKIIQSLQDTLTEKIEEFPIGTYTIEFESPLACPTECLTTYGTDEVGVCSGKGICATDPYAKKIRCLCDHGYQGTKCQYRTDDIVVYSNKRGGLMALIVLSLLLLCLASVCVIYLCIQIHIKEEEQMKAVSGNKKGFLEPILEEQNPNINNPSMGLTQQNIQTNDEVMQSNSKTFNPLISVDESIQNEVAASMKKEENTTNIDIESGNDTPMTNNDNDEPLPTTTDDGNTNDNNDEITTDAALNDDNNNETSNPDETQE